MNLNIFQPRKAVESAFKKPNLALAMAIVLLPILASLASRAAFGVSLAVENAVIEIALAYFSFFLLALIVFGLALILKSRETKGKAAGFLSALSLMATAQLAIVLLSAVAILLCFSPAAMNAATAAGNVGDSQIAANLMQYFVEQNPTAVNVPLLMVFVAIAFAIFVLEVYLIYLAVKRLAGTGVLGGLALAFIGLLIWGILTFTLLA